MFNPFKAYRRLRDRKEKRRDIELRQKSIDISTRFGDPLQVNLYRAHVIFLYMKYGVSNHGISIDEIFDKHDFTRELKYLYPEGPIKL